MAWLQDPTTKLEDEEIEEIEARAPEAYRMLSDRQAWGSDELSRLAAFALAGIAARIDAAEAIDALIQALKDPDEDVRWYAADALGHLGSARALPHLERLTKDDAESRCGLVADAARIAIERVSEAQRRSSRRK